MSNAAINPAAAMPDAGHGHDSQHAHDPHLAHHFDTPEQQYQSSKLGMWVFLGTEILMFGGLFCAYSVYRHNHPEVFEFAHKYLNKPLGAVNTVVLITSSLTMAWGVRAAQMGKQGLLVVLLALTILGGFGFMGIKSIEYRDKWHHQLWFGAANQYNKNFKGTVHGESEGGEHEAAVTGVAGRPVTTEGGGVAPASGHTAAAAGHDPAQAHLPASATTGPATGSATTAAAAPAPTTSETLAPGLPIDPFAGTPDASKVHPNFVTPPGLSPAYTSAGAHKQPETKFGELDAHDRDRVSTFFSIYFVMTGLHGLHVVVGMSLIFWILMRAGGTMTKAWAPPMGIGSIGLFFIFVGYMVGVNSVAWIGVLLCGLGLIWAAMRVPAASKAKQSAGEFSPTFFTPVDLVGLYWHIVDLIWIFLFPLLYLIH